MTTNLIQIAPALIARSLTNPRKTFDQGKLAELAESIRASGLHQPVVVRPLPASRMEDTAAMSPRPTHELVAGERRWRASTMAGLEEMPAIVRELTDEQVLEIQVIENLQRDDLSSLEEAEGYEHLMKHSSLSAEQLADKIGKSRSYVFARLKLLDLHQEGREALRSGAIDTSKALLIARVPGQALQQRAVTELSRKDIHGGEGMSARAAAAWVRNNLMLKLATAVFDIKDAKLCPEAGSCMQCSKRTGANPDLFADVDSPDVCTDPTCFADKKEAHAERVVAKARKRGLEVIDGDEAKNVKPYPGSFMRNYAPVDEKVDSDVEGDSTLRQLLTPEERKQIKVLIDPHTKQPIEVLDEDVADAAIARLEAKSAKASGSRATPKSSAKQREQELQVKRNALEVRYHTTWRRAAHDEIAPRVKAEEIKSFDPAMLRAVLFHQVAPHGAPEVDDLVAVMDAGDQDFDGVEETTSSLGKIDDLLVGQTLLLWLLKAEIDPMSHWNNGVREVYTHAPMIEACAARLEIDLQAIREQVKADMRAEFAEFEKPSEPLPSAAQATEPAAGKPKKGAGKKAKSAPAANLSIADAEQGIAAAMQEAEAAASTAEEQGAAAAAQSDEAGADDGPGDHDTSEEAPRFQAAWPFPKTKGSGEKGAQA